MLALALVTAPQSSFTLTLALALTLTLALTLALALTLSLAHALALNQVLGIALVISSVFLYGATATTPVELCENTLASIRCQ